MFILTCICGPAHRCLGNIKSAMTTAKAACKEDNSKHFQLGSVARFKTHMRCHLMFMFVKTFTMHHHEDEINNAVLKTMINFATSHWCKSEKAKNEKCHPPNNVIQHCILSCANSLQTMMQQNGVQLFKEFDEREAMLSLENTVPLQKTSFAFLNAANFIDCRTFEFDCNQFCPKMGSA